jgi:predicted nucleotidyltransferase
VRPSCGSSARPTWSPSGTSPFPRSSNCLAGPSLRSHAKVERLSEAGLLETELRSGRRSVWAATTSPIFDELHSILLKTIGPKAVLEERFRDVRGVDRALIYGSWARRYHGVPGPLRQDVDLMVVGTGDVAEIRAEVDIASRRLGRDVDVSVLTPEEWDASESGFVTQLKSEPSVELSLLR